MLQIAPRGFGGMHNPDIVYAPHRDLAHMFVPCIRQVVHALSEEQRPEWLAAHCRAHGITDEQLADGLKCLIDATMLFHNAAKFPSEAEALEQAGFNALSLSVQHAIFSAIGRFFVAAFCAAIRDLTIAGKEPAKAQTLAELADRIERAQQKLACATEDSDAGDSS